MPAVNCLVRAAGEAATKAASRRRRHPAAAEAGVGPAGAGRVGAAAAAVVRRKRVQSLQLAGGPQGGPAGPAGTGLASGTRAVDDGVVDRGNGSVAGVCASTGTTRVSGMSAGSRPAGARGGTRWARRR